MNEIQKAIFEEAKKYLAKGFNKDFIKHTESVIKAVLVILEKEKGDKDLLITSAILHDVGWAYVSEDLQKKRDKRSLKKAFKKHLKKARPAIFEILSKFDFSKKEIVRIAKVVRAHESEWSLDINKKILFDADNLSDCYKDDLYADAEKWKKTPSEMYDFRIANNKFYTKTAQDIFDKEMGDRLKEINGE